MRIFILHAGGLGDLVLFAPALKAMRSAMPDTEITFCCRGEFVSIVELLPFRIDSVLGLPLNPYACDPLEASVHDELSSFVASVRASQPDLFVSAECRATWLTPLLIAAMRPARSFAALVDLRRVSLDQRLLERFDLSPEPCETYDANEDVREHARYDALLERIGVPKAEPFSFVFPERARDEAARVVHDLGLADSSMLACFTAGNPLVPLKRWPTERFVSVIKQAARRHTLVPVFFGEASERSELEQTVRTLAERGVRAHAHIDATQSVSLTAAILARASAFLGNDTGLSHLGAALGIPGVTVYGGGGYFERYAPWAPGTLGVVHRLPCFGCGWDCAFGRAVCIESIETADVAAALDRVLQSPPPAPVIAEFSHRTEAELCLIDEAARMYAGIRRELESTREEMELQSIAARERLHVIEELDAHARARSERELLLRHIGEQEIMIRELAKAIEALS
jgi:ADP-heptose:LPS heptosyltransferase